MRRRTAAALIALGLGTGVIAGCGGDDSSEEEVPATPPELGIPHDRNAGGQLPTGGDQTPSKTTTDPSVTVETTGGDDAADSGAPSGGDTGADDTGGAPATQQPSQAPTQTPPSQTGGSAAPGTGNPAPDTGGDQGGANPGPGGADGNDFDQFCDQNPGAC